MGNLPRLRREPVRSRGGVIGSSAQTDASPERGAILIRQRWVCVRRVLNAGETAQTRAMASLIAKIRKWLRIGKKS